MLVVVAVLLALAVSQTACRESPPPAASSSASPPPVSLSTQQPARLRVEGDRFVTVDGSAFQWRGITAFRLLDYIADSQEDEARRFLEWASERGLTVVRVVSMMSGLFDLSPADGRRALPRLLELAAQRGLYVQVVGLANTLDIPVDLVEHVSEIGRILAAHPNGLLEIANEPVHPTQSPEVHKPEVLADLAKRIPPVVPVALGSIERGDGFGAGRYITWHAPRESGRGGWGHVLVLTEGATLLARWKKPVVSDEPIGAGAEWQPGRRDNDAARFRAAALLTRLVGMGATFHYEAGLQARIPAGRELECFNAWNEAWTLLPLDVEHRGVFRTSGSRDAIARTDNDKVLGMYERSDSERGWVLVLGEGELGPVLADGWSVADTRAIGGGTLLSVARAIR